MKIIIRYNKQPQTALAYYHYINVLSSNFTFTKVVWEGQIEKNIQKIVKNRHKKNNQTNYDHKSLFKT